jgi:acetyl esterase/lipase
MNQVRLFLAVSALALAPASHAALKPIDGAVTVSENKSVAVFKSTPQGELKIHLYFPKDWKASDHRAAIVFFFGGGFINGTPRQFTTTAEYFASRGMVAASCEYRIRNTHHTGPEASIEDAKSAVRWLRANAASLGIDSSRVLAGGGSAGATCAAFAAYNTSYEPEGEDTSISSKPNALVLYNPALGFGRDTSQFQPELLKMGGFLLSWKVTKGGPPAILFFGTEDSLLEKARDFAGRMQENSNRVELYTAAGQKHGFFNDRFNDRPGSPWHAPVVHRTDLFLASLGYLQGPPTISLPADRTIALKREIP